MGWYTCAVKLSSLRLAKPQVMPGQNSSTIGVCRRDYEPDDVNNKLKLFNILDLGAAVFLGAPQPAHTAKLLRPVFLTYPCRLFWCEFHYWGNCGII